MNCMRFSSMGTGWPFNIFAFRETDDTVTPSANTVDRHWSRTYRLSENSPDAKLIQFFPFVLLL